jgi:hypothetical protein
MIKKLEKILNYEKNIFYFCFSLFMVLFVNYLSSKWWITFITIDPWVYWGTSQNFDYFLAHFSDTYYFSFLTWVACLSWMVQFSISTSIFFQNSKKLNFSKNFFIFFYTFFIYVSIYVAAFGSDATRQN